MSATTPVVSSRPSSTASAAGPAGCPPEIGVGDVRRYTHIVHFGGRHFAATRTMADIFMARAGDVIDRDDSELVPLLHQHGVDLLLVTPSSSIAVSQIDIGAIGAIGSTPRIRSAQRRIHEEIAS